MISKHTCAGYWRDRMGLRKNAVSLTGVSDFTLAQTFLTAIAVYSNMALLRVTQTTTNLEAVTGQTPSTGHFDLGGYVARMTFYNYKAEAAGDSPNTTLVLPAPTDAIIQETKEGIWVVDETTGQTIADLMAAALGLTAGDIEYIKGEVPEN